MTTKQALSYTSALVSPIGVMATVAYPPDLERETEGGITYGPHRVIQRYSIDAPGGPGWLTDEVIDIRENAYRVKCLIRRNPLTDLETTSGTA